MAPGSQNSFEFDSDKTTEQNLDLFYQFIKSEDAEFGKLLETAVTRMSPLPEGSQRAEIRSLANSEIEEALDGDTEDSNDVVEPQEEE